MGGTSSISRPSEYSYTPAIGDKLIAAIPRFLRLRDVAQSQGVRYVTLVSWLQIGAHPGAPKALADFTTRFAIAESEFQAQCLQLASEGIKLRFNDVPLSDLSTLLKDLPKNVLTPTYEKFVKNALALAKKNGRRKVPRAEMTVSIEFQPSKVVDYLIQNRWRFSDKDITVDEILSIPQMKSREDQLNNPTPAMRALLDRTGWVRRELTQVVETKGHGT